LRATKHPAPCKQIGIAVMHLGRLHLDSSWLSVLVAFQCVLLWFRLNYFRCVKGGGGGVCAR
jgi:hypothetical protein